MSVMMKTNARLSGFFQKAKIEIHTRRLLKEADDTLAGDVDV